MLTTLLLFADTAITAAEPTAGIPTGGWVVIGGIAGSLFTYLGNRDKLRFDTKLTKLEDGHAKCQEESAAQKVELANLRTEIAELKARDKTDRRELEAKIDTVVAAVDKQGK